MAVLICIFLMTNDTEHVFMCLAAICMSSSVRFVPLPTFSFFLTIRRFLYLLEISPFKISTLLQKKSLFSNQIGFFCFLILRMLYILDTNILLDILFTDFFSEVLACISIWFLESFREACNFYEAKFINYSFYG